jgi:hypothetical protein
MEKLSKYKKQIFTFITIFLLLEFGVYPCLTAADTFTNIIGAVALLLLVIWGGIELYTYVTTDKGGLVNEVELEEAAKMVTKPKTKRKPKVTKSEYPLPPHHPISKAKKTK